MVLYPGVELLGHMVAQGPSLMVQPTMKETQKTQFVSLLGRSPGGGNGIPLEYSCLKNPMDRGTFASKGSQRVGHDWETKHSTEHMIVLVLFF